MSREDVMRLALEAGLFDDDQEPLPECLERFANLVIEECAKVCEELEEDDASPLFVSQQCANAIRARKSK